MHMDQMAPEDDDSSWKVFNDPVHGSIALHPVCVAIIDTPQFQRLRNIKQLGGGYYVYPGASHNRFEHSIGVCHLAGKLVRVLRKRHPELIDDKDVLCVEIAGLCHDLGHGPFSHVFDNMVIPGIRKKSGKKVEKWKHENASLDMLDHMIKQNSRVKEEMLKWNILEETDGPEGFNPKGKDLNFIKNLIFPEDGNQKRFEEDGREPEKNFLFSIVANKESEVDVDKLDYIARDCHHLGMRSTFDHDRFIQFVRVSPDENGKMQLCVRDKEAFSIYQLFQTRHSLHTKAYQHKMKCGVEYMIEDILVSAKDAELIPGKRNPRKRGSADARESPKKMKIEKCIGDCDAYTNLTDDVLQLIRVSDDPLLEESQELLKAFDSRNLYRCVAQSNPSQKFTEADRNDIETKLKQKSTLNKDRILVKMVILDFGKKAENPVNEQFFYTKKDPNRAIHIREIEVSRLLPKETFQEELIRVYLKPDLSKERSREILEKESDDLKRLSDEVFKEVEEKKKSSEGPSSK